MSDLTETEIFSCLETNFPLAAEQCEALAVNPVKGPTYKKLRETLKLLEGACRQAGFWREDIRWNEHSKKMAKVHEMAGDCLRDYKSKANMYTFFCALADAMRRLHKEALALKNKKTGHVGIILPYAMMEQKNHLRRITRSRSGLILPNTVTLGNA